MIKYAVSMTAVAGQQLANSLFERAEKYSRGFVSEPHGYPRPETPLSS